MEKKSGVFALTLVLCTLAVPASATPIIPGLYGTGFITGGGSLQSQMGAEGNWSLFTTSITTWPGNWPSTPPSGTSATAYVVQRTDTYSNVMFPFAGGWQDNSSTAQWIAPQASYAYWNVGGTSGDPAGLYVYSLSFDLTGYDPNTASITGTWYADNAGALYLNDALTSSFSPNVTIASGNTDFPSGYTGPDPYSFETSASDPTLPADFHTFTLNSGFVSGVNYLDFVIYNAPGTCVEPGVCGDPSGLQASLSGTANLVPEPGTFLLLGAGLILIGGFRRRK